VRGATWVQARFGDQAAEPVLPDPSEELRSLALDSDRFREVLRFNLDHNGAELHSLIPLRLLRQAAARVGSDFEGEVLEVGSYGHPGFALSLLLLGAQRVHLDNVTRVDNRLRRSHAETLYALMSGFGLPISVALDEVIEPAGEGMVRIRSERVVIHSGVDAANLELEPGSLRAVFSMAVLEHVKEPAPLLAVTQRLLEPGGWFFHAVDLRDHKDLANPLRFLAQSEEEYRAEDPGGNRWRGPDYVRACEEVGFDLTHVDYAGPVSVNAEGTTDVFSMLLQPAGNLFRPLPELEVWVSEEARSRLQPQFHGYSLAELSGTSVNLTGRKPSQAGQGS